MGAAAGQDIVDVLGAERAEQGGQRGEPWATPAPVQSTSTGPVGVEITLVGTGSGWMNASGNPRPSSPLPNSSQMAS